MIFLHAADIHLDSPLRGLPEYEGAPVEEIRNATRAAFRNMIDLAIDRQVNFLIIAGDLYDGNWRSYDTGLVFREQMSRLDKEGIPAFIVHGNHDAASRITKGLTMPANVTVFSHRKAETHLIEELGVALHGQSFKTQHVTEDLSAEYPDRVVDLFNIGVLHTAADGREGHAPYAPCSTAELTAKGYDYWALGHVHNREILSEDPPIVFPGNIQGRHIREETTDGKGCTLVSVDEAGHVELAHEPLDTVRWRRLEADLSDTETIGDIVALVSRELSAAHEAADDRLLAARVRLTGETQMHGQMLSDPDHLVNEIRGAAMDVAVGEIWIEKLILDTRPVTSIEDLSTRGDSLGDVARILQGLLDEPETRSALIGELEPIFSKLPADVTERFPDVKAVLEDEESMSDIMRQASDLALFQLAKAEVPE